MTVVDLHLLLYAVNADSPHHERARHTRGAIRSTGSYTAYAEVDLGVLRIEKGGSQAVVLRPGDAASWKPVNVLWVRLVSEGDP